MKNPCAATTQRSGATDKQPDRPAARLIVDRLSIEIGAQTLVADVSFAVQPGSVHCLVGDSGSGKTLSGLASLGLLPRCARGSGSIRLEGVDANLLMLDQSLWSAIRGNKIGYVGQNALGCLHPAFRVGAQVVEAIRRHQPMSRSEAGASVITQLDAVGLPEPERVARSYPAELSGGMCQRVAIAIALCNHPSVLIADEPTTALDDETQGLILELIRTRVESEGLGVLLITHDQRVVEQVADEITTISHGVSTSCPPSVSVDVPASPPLALSPIAPSPLVVRPKPANGDAVLEVAGVAKSYSQGSWPRRSRVDAVRDVSFTAEPGETIGLVGRSGAGKTTLAQIIAGVLAPTQGSVHIAGRPVTGPERVARRERAELVQYVFQDPFGALNPRRAVFAQVAETLIVAGEPACVATERARKLLADVGLDTAQIDRTPTGLSGGQCQRVNIARALIRRPAMVVLDEPVSALDWSIRDEIMAILAEQQAATGALFLLISHERALIERESDRVFEVIDGALHAA